MATVTVVAAYDVTADNRRARLSALLQAYGDRVQRSVFLARGEAAELDELRRRDFTIFIVSGGGTEFVRAVSEEIYGVPPQSVVGTLLAYDVARREDGAPWGVRPCTGRH